MLTLRRSPRFTQDNNIITLRRSPRFTQDNNIITLRRSSRFLVGKFTTDNIIMDEPIELDDEPIVNEPDEIDIVKETQALIDGFNSQIIRFERIGIISKIYGLYNKNVELYNNNTGLERFMLESFITMLYIKSFEFMKDIEQKKYEFMKDIEQKKYCIHSKTLTDEINIYRQLSHQHRNKQVKININNLLLKKLIKYTLYNTILNDDCIDKVLLFYYSPPSQQEVRS